MPGTNNNMQIPGRIIIVTKDVVVMYACHRTTAGRKLDKIREHLNKPEGEVTMYEFSEFTGIPLEIVRKSML